MTGSHLFLWVESRTEWVELIALKQQDTYSIIIIIIITIIIIIIRGIWIIRIIITHQLPQLIKTRKLRNLASLMNKSQTGENRCEGTCGFCLASASILCQISSLSFSLYFSLQTESDRSGHFDRTWHWHFVSKHFHLIFYWRFFILRALV